MILLFLVTSTTVFSQKIKVACIGNSITEGARASSSATNYPSVLQKNIGTQHYDVRNFGASGRTMLKLEADMNQATLLL